MLLFQHTYGMVSDKPIMAKCCNTCPFKQNERGMWRDVHLANEVIQRNLFNSQQVCHHPRLSGKEETHRCRGYYDYAFEIYDRMGLDPINNLKNHE